MTITVGTMIMINQKVRSRWTGAVKMVSAPGAVTVVGVSPPPHPHKRPALVQQ
jgi:hypothetical protein